MKSILDENMVDLGRIDIPQHKSMKIILDETPASLVIVTPHGSIQLEVWPAQQTSVTVKPNENHSDQCLRSDESSRIILKPRS